MSKMASKMVETVSKTFIKPSSPTPQSLRRYNLSSYDQIVLSEYGSIAFFFINPCHGISTIRQKLQNSLSKILVHYYPFAGRLVKNEYIDCNDQGVEFVEVQIHCPIHDILKKTRSYATNLVFARNEMAARPEESLAAIQLSHFDCGGVALGVCINSKLGDGSTSTAFLQDWAASTRLSSHIPAPLLLSDSLFPGRDGLLPLPYFDSPNCITRKFVFPAAEIENLRSKAVESGIQQPTRVEVVTALIYRCAMLASPSINRGLSRPSVVCEAVNLRPFLALPPNSLGNLYSFYFCFNEDDGIEFPALVGQLRKAKLEFQNLPREKLCYESQMQELQERLKQLNIRSFDFYLFSSYCRFPINKVDFGWGKAKWVTMLPNQSQEIYLGSLDGNEVEALVTLEEEKMSAFENSAEILPFASSDCVKWKSKL